MLVAFWARFTSAGEVLTAKQAPHRPGTAPALGLRAGKVAASIIEQTTVAKEIPMWFRSMFNSLKSRGAGSPARPKGSRACRRRPGAQLLLEALEDRCLPSFLAPVNYAVGANPQAVVTADLGNGKLDIITANAGSSAVSVLLGNGNGTFQTAVNYATGTTPVAVAVGDLNGDGKLDIVTANAGSSTVSVLLGNGDGTFKSAVNYATGPDPVSVAIGKFNGKPDIVTANQGDDSVSLLPGNGDGTFGAAQKVASFSAPAVSVAVGDFNGDGKLDLAVATRGTDGYFGWYGYYPGNSPAVNVLLGNGNGTFTTGSFSGLPSPYFVPPSSYAPPAVAAADLNGDGKPDLLVTDAGDYAVDVLLNNGNGTFTGPTSFSADGPDWVAVADINGDGKLDLVTANSRDTVSVLPGNGKGAFGDPYYFTVGSSPASVAAGDFNGDGWNDLAVANSGDNNVSVLLNTGYWPALQVAATNPATGAAITSTTAGQSFNLTVTAEDPFGKVLTGYTDTVSFSASDGQGTIIDPTTGNPVSLQNFTYTFTAADHGTHTFSVDLKTAGGQLVAVRDFATGITATGPDITVNPGPVSTFVVGGNGFPFPSPTTAGYYGEFTVTAYDAYGNWATNYTGTVIFSSTDPHATIIDPATGNPVALAGFTYTFSPYDYGTAYSSAALNTVGSQSITAKDSVNSKATGSQTGIEVDLAVTVSGPYYGYINQPLTFTLGTIGDPAGTVFTYKINWGDGSPLQTVTGPNGTQVMHAFSTAGYSYFTVTATDPNGLTGSTSGYVYTLPVTVAIQTDPAHTSQQMLVIKDSGYGDSITLASAANNSVSLTVDGYNLGTIAPTNSNPFALVMVFETGWYESTDARNLGISSVLVGGSGSDYLYGGSARNLLIAGLGADTLHGGSAGDILIGGHTSYDSNTTALAYIMAEWDSSDSYSTRVNKLSKGGGLNGAYVLNSTTVIDNGVTDYLYGGTGLDWFFAHLRGRKHQDQIYGQTSGEVSTQI
jgi:hypothetical protein